MGETDTVRCLGGRRLLQPGESTKGSSTHAHPAAPGDALGGPPVLGRFCFDSAQRSAVPSEAPPGIADFLGPSADVARPWCGCGLSLHGGS